MPPCPSLELPLTRHCLCIGEMIQLHLLCGWIRSVIAGFLSTGDRILLITAGDGISQNAMCYRSNTLTDDGYLGSVRYVHGGIAFIELVVETRDDVSNMVMSQIPGQQCFSGPVIQPPSQTPTAALLHRGHQQPEVITLEQRQFPGVNGACLCFRAQVPVNGILGSVVTSAQAGVGGSRLLDVYGPVYATKDLNGVRYALVGNMQEAIQALQTLEEYSGTMISPVNPIQQAGT